jgi:predicted nucleotidyltransferase
MRSQLPALALELGADERTLRRAARRGTVRCHRPGPRQLELDAGEREYLREHWALLSALTRALRTEPNVSVAVLYGSTARGDDRAASDVDLLVALRDDSAMDAAGVAERLGRAVHRPVDVARLPRVEKQSPLLLLFALDEGRVLVDRDGRWAALRKRRSRIIREARQSLEQSRREAAESMRMLEEDID